MVLPLILAAEAAEGLMGAGAAAEGIGAAAGAGATAARALPMASRFGDLFNTGGLAVTAAGLADDIPAIASMIMKHGESANEPPAQQQQREQQIVASRDKLVAKLVQGGMPPEQASKQVNDQLAPAIEQARNRQQGDPPKDGGGGWGSVLGAGLMAGLPALGALRGGMGLAKAAYAAKSAAPSFLGKPGQMARGLMAGQGELMKAGVRGVPAPPTAQPPMPPAPVDPNAIMQQAAMARLRPQAPPNMAGQMEQIGQGAPPNFTMAPAGGGRGLPYTPPSMPPPNARGAQDYTGPDVQVMPPVPGATQMNSSRGFVITPEVERALMLLRQQGAAGG